MVPAGGLLRLDIKPSDFPQNYVRSVTQTSSRKIGAGVTFEMIIAIEEGDIFTDSCGDAAVTRCTCSSSVLLHSKNLNPVIGERNCLGGFVCTVGGGIVDHYQFYCAEGLIEHRHHCVWQVLFVVVGRYDN
ncbi:hypothetical protein BAU01nite_23320 [Brevibacterium aurantiacum]|nr:hypothetical protein BAU01nite_23320 [Brevibacterium aurantiacum]